MTDDRPLLVKARAALLDALDALGPHAESIVVIGAQAIHLHTGDMQLALAPLTKDADLGVDVRSLGADPLIEDALRDAGFYPDPVSEQPGAWCSPTGMPVDLMVPDALAGGRGSRSVHAPPHDKRSMRRAVGLEAAVVDNEVMTIGALDDDDPRTHAVKVAGPAALIVAKAHKVGERLRDAPQRAQAKDAHDLYRVLVAIPTQQLADAMAILLSDELAGEVVVEAIEYLRTCFGSPDAEGSVLAGEAELGVGEPVQVATATSLLVADLLGAVGSRR